MGILWMEGNVQLRSLAFYVGKLLNCCSPEQADEVGSLNQIKHYIFLTMYSQGNLK
jgi:hypothetical protein